MDLQRQVEEFEALRAMYPEEEGCFVLAAAEQEVWAAAAAANAATAATEQYLGSLSGTIRLPDVLLDQQPVALRFQLPAGYPSAESPLLSVECSTSRVLHEQLSAAVHEAAAAAVGSESLLLVLGALQEAVEAAVAAGSYTAQEPTVDCAEHLSHRTGGHGTAAGAEGAEGGIGDSSRSERECPFDALQVVIWFHHIKSTEKRKNLVAWARELDCSGFSKPGFPGVVVVEGLVSDVREYVGRVRALQWQAMQVRAEHTVCCAACSNGGGQQLLPSPRADSQLQEQQQLGQGLQQQQQQQHKRGSLQQQQQQQQPAARAFTGKFTELPESGMSQLSLECKAAGMEDLFLAALKLTK